MKQLLLVLRHPCNIVIPVIIILLCAGCSSESPDEKIPSVHQEINEEGMFAEVIVPAGFSATGSSGFLPYPGNWAVFRNPQREDLKTVILSDALAKGSLLEVAPIALLQLDSSGTQINIIVSVPTDTALTSIELTGFVDLLTDHEPVRHILQTWFVNHQGFGSFELVGWRDEEAARKLLNQ